MGQHSEHGAIAAGHELTAKAAEEMLRAGGSAVDAAIAAAAMACVVEPVLAGPAGGGFAMVRADARAEPALCDFFSQTPKRRNPSARVEAIEADFGDATQTFHIGPGTVATPGFMPGLLALHGRHGRLPWAALLEPAAQVAEEGHPLSHFQATLPCIIAPILLHTKEARRVFAPSGSLIQAGETLRNPGLARLWRLLAEGGEEAWKNEVWPALLAVASPQAGGHLREDDLADYAVCWRTPLLAQQADARVWLNPPPAASGVMIALALARLRELLAEEECFICACARALDHADRLRRDADHDLAKLLAALPASWRGTTHISVIDADGMACAMTVSNGEGNGHMVGDFGFMPNNMLGEEDVNPAGAASFPEDVRLSSMMAPTLAENAHGLQVALGSGGSNRIRSALLLTLARLLLRGEDLAHAVEAPRLHVENGALDVEPGLSPSELTRLRELFAEMLEWSQPSMFFGGVHAVARAADGALAAVGDFRREGVGRLV